jgi:hypothetical protein
VQVDAGAGPDRSTRVPRSRRGVCLALALAVVRVVSSGLPCGSCESRGLESAWHLCADSRSKPTRSSLASTGMRWCGRKSPLRGYPACPRSRMCRSFHHSGQIACHGCVSPCVSSPRVSSVSL